MQLFQPCIRPERVTQLASSHLNMQTRCWACSPIRNLHICTRHDTRVGPQMSGDISLTCTWRVTPLDMAALKVKTKQSKLDRKVEVLALLEERTGALSPQISPGGPVGSPEGDIVGNLSPVASPNTGLAEQKRLMASWGVLSLNVGCVWCMGLWWGHLWHVSQEIQLTPLHTHAGGSSAVHMHKDTIAGCEL